VEPEYPELAKRTRLQGMVILVVTVDEEGNVTDIRVTRGHPILVEAAKAAVSQWKYSPTLLNGEPIPVTATVTVNFVLGR
jgi:protein TonB